MKKLLTIVVLCLLFNTNSNADSFCKGYDDGFQKGLRYIFDLGLTPLCPLQPLRKIGDPSDDYGHGFNVGLRQACKGDSLCVGLNKR